MCQCVNRKKVTIKAYLGLFYYLILIRFSISAALRGEGGTLIPKIPHTLVPVGDFGELRIPPSLPVNELDKHGFIGTQNIFFPLHGLFPRVGFRLSSEAQMSISVCFFKNEAVCVCGVLYFFFLNRRLSLLLTHAGKKAGAFTRAGEPPPPLLLPRARPSPTRLECEESKTETRPLPRGCACALSPPRARRRHPARARARHLTPVPLPEPPYPVQPQTDPRLLPRVTSKPSDSAPPPSVNYEPKQETRAKASSRLSLGAVTSLPRLDLPSLPPSTTSREREPMSGERRAAAAGLGVTSQLLPRPFPLFGDVAQSRAEDRRDVKAPPRRPGGWA